MTTSNIFRSAFEAFMNGRQLQADRYVARSLLAFDDETLRAHGYDRAVLKRRAGPHL
jgi:hypothetical protein